MRKILEDLIFEGEIKETYKIYGKTWVLKALNADEQLAATSSTKSYDNVARIPAIKIAVVSRALKSVNDIELSDLTEKIEFLGKLPPQVVDALYEKYLELQKKQKDSLDEMESELKN